MKAEFRLKICRCIDERGSALERGKGSGRPKSVRTPTNGLSRKGSYAGEIPYHNLRPMPKTIRELKVALKFMWEKLPLEPMNRDIKTLKKYSEHVWVLVVDTLNSCCETIIKSV